jgi:hypothetical protein
MSLSDAALGRRRQLAVHPPRGVGCRPLMKTRFLRHLGRVG